MERLHEIVAEPQQWFWARSLRVCAMQTMERLLQDPVDAKAKMRP